MEEEENMLPPFWVQNGHRRRLHRSYSLFLSSSAILILLLVITLVFLFIIVPTLHSFTSDIFNPHSVKKSWNSLNLVLVLFAIVCGFFSRNSNETPRSDEDQSFSNTSQEYAKSNPETPRSWYEYEYSDRTAYKSVNSLRSFNSYPDLRQESSWVAADERWRFYDDTHVSGYRGLDLDEHRQLRHRNLRSEAGEEEQGIKNIAVDTFVVRTREVPSAPPLPELQTPPSPSPLPSSTPPAPHSEDVRRNAKRTNHAEMIEKPKNNYLRAESLQPRPSTPPRPRLPPPPTERKTVQNKKKRGSAAKEFLTSLRGKKKKQRQKSIENFESIINSEPPPLASPPPPPPPPPPLPSVFHNMFSSKKIKYKKNHSSSPPPPPRHVSSMRVTKTKPLNGGAATHEHSLSNKKENFYPLEENVITGNESPLIPIPPPPPPPPPFKMPAWKFRVQGDFVRIDSISSSRSGSPDLDEVAGSPTSQDDGEPAILLLYPSPDVDTKADTFIQRFRAGLKMEKMDSMKEKQGTGRSNLGPS